MITLKGLSAYLLTTALAASLVFALPLASNDDHRPADSSSNINSKIPFRIRGRPKEIVNGTETEPFAFPWIAQISHLDDHYCGGVFIAPDVILTAAHCSKFEPSEYNVSWHRHDLRKSTNQEKGQDFIVEKIIKHSNYLQPSFGSDIALWKLAPVGDTQHLPDIGYIELDDGSVASDVGLMLTSAGWGSTSFLGETSSVLMQVSVPIVDQEVCRQNYRGKINHEMVCAGYEQGGKDSCQGDSGGPLFVQDEAGNSILVGLVSWGKGCAWAGGYVGVYARIGALREWVFETLKEL